jgi:hypothetical protein
MFKPVALSLIIGVICFLIPFFSYNSILSLFDVDVVYTDPRQSGIDSIICAIGFFLLGFFVVCSSFWLNQRIKVLANIALSLVTLVVVFVLKAVIFVPDSQYGMLSSDLKLYLIPFYALVCVFVVFVLLKITNKNKS